MIESEPYHMGKMYILSRYATESYSKHKMRAYTKGNLLEIFPSQRQEPQQVLE